MLRLVGQRTAFIGMVILAIIFFVHMGMRMSQNSSALEPNYDLVRFAQESWSDTRAYLTNIFNNELGSTRANNQTVPIWDVLKESYINSMGLLLAAMLSATLLGIIAGMTMALTKYRRLIIALLVLTIVGMSMPAFFGGLLLQRVEIFYVSRGGAPLVKMAGFGWNLEYMLLPMIVLAARPLAYITRSSFLSLNRIMEEDFIRTAYSKGLSTARTVNVHAMKNIAVPFLTAVGVSLRFALTALPVVEFFFVWPGIGMRLLQAINLRQTTLAVTLALAL